MAQILLEPVPPAAPIIDPVNFRDGVIYPIADLLGIDSAKDISEARLRRWGNAVSRHVRYAWDFWAWDQLALTEERAFRPVWNATRAWTNGDDIFDITSQAYYEVTGGNPPAGTLPTDPLWFSPLTLGVDDYTIPLRQGCRRKIGTVRAVYPANPRTMASARVATLPFTVSERGVEVLGAGPTVFVRYQLPPFRYTGRKWDAGGNYLPESLVYYAGAGEFEAGAGEVYRAIRPVTGTAPNDDDAGLYWALVPFPAFLADYVVYMVAAEDAEDLATARAWASMAPDFLKGQADTELAQGGPRNRFGGSATGYNYWGGSSYYYQIPAAEVVNTISDVCVNQWGDPLDVPTPGRTIWLLTPGAGIYTPDPGVRALYVEVCGGGGGSAGALGATGSAAAAGGGGGGGYAAQYYPAPLAHYGYTVGAGGAAGGAAPSQGGSGVATIFGTGPLLTGGGGSGSTVPTAGTILQISGVGGGGGGAPSGDAQIKGSLGGMGMRYSGTSGYGGYGGASAWGGAAGSGTSAQSAGVAGAAIGGGAAGASSNSTSGQAGAAGAPGAIKITEYF